MENLMVWVYYFMIMEILNMKEIIKMISEMDMDIFIIEMVL